MIGYGELPTQCFDCELASNEVYRVSSTKLAMKNVHAKEGIMKALDIRDRICDSVSSIRPLDDTERQHIDFVLNWIQSGAEIFRIEKPATPPKGRWSTSLSRSREVSRLPDASLY